MKAIAIILLIVGSVGLVMSMMMYGDIGISAAIGSITALVSGIGFMRVNKYMENSK